MTTDQPSKRSRIVRWIAIVELAIIFGTAIYLIFFVIRDLQHGSYRLYYSRLLGHHYFFPLIPAGIMLLTLAISTVCLVWTFRIQRRPAPSSVATPQYFLPRAFCVLAIIISVIAILLLLERARQSRIKVEYMTCVQNLRYIQVAKEQWWLEKRKSAEDTPTWDDLLLDENGRPYSEALDNKPYLKHKYSCPAKGVYTIGPVKVTPTCSISGHVLH